MWPAAGEPGPGSVMTRPIDTTVTEDVPAFFRYSVIRVLILFAFHAIVFTACYLLAWLIRFEFEIPPRMEALMQSSLPFVIGVQLIVGAFFGFYRGWWRYVGITDVLRLVFGMSAAVALMVAAWYGGRYLGLPERFVRPPRGVLLIDWAFAL